MRGARGGPLALLIARRMLCACVVRAGRLLLQKLVVGKPGKARQAEASVVASIGAPTLRATHAALSRGREALYFVSARSPGADVAGASPIPVQMWVGGMSPVPVQMR